MVQQFFITPNGTCSVHLHQRQSARPQKPRGVAPLDLASDGAARSPGLAKGARRRRECRPNVCRSTANPPRTSSLADAGGGEEEKPPSPRAALDTRSLSPPITARDLRGPCPPKPHQADPFFFESWGSRSTPSRCLPWEYDAPSSHIPRRPGTSGVGAKLRSLGEQKPRLDALEQKEAHRARHLTRQLFADDGDALLGYLSEKQASTHESSAASIASNVCLMRAAPPAVPPPESSLLRPSSGRRPSWPAAEPSSISAPTSAGGSSGSRPGSSWLPASTAGALYSGHQLYGCLKKPQTSPAAAPGSARSPRILAGQQDTIATGPTSVPSMSDAFDTGWPVGWRSKPVVRVGGRAPIPEDPFQRYLNASTRQGPAPALTIERTNKRWSTMHSVRQEAETVRGNHCSSGFAESSPDHSTGGGSVPSPIALQGKTAGMVDSMAKWLNSNTGMHHHHYHQQGGHLEEDSAAESEKREFRNIIIWSKRHKMEVSDVRESRREFLEMERKAPRPVVGVISKDEFFTLIRKRIQLSAEEAIPAHLTNNVVFSQDGGIDFDEYLRWHQQHAWTEEMLMPRQEERKLRQLAREQCMQLLDVERIKRFFDEFDTDGSQEIDEEEFKHVLYRILGVRNESDMPASRLQRYWREVDTDGSGSVCFIEFLVWYHNALSKETGVEEL